MNKLRRFFGYKEKSIDSIIKITDTRAYITKEDFFNQESVKKTIEKLTKSPLIQKIDSANQKTVGAID